MVQMGSERFYGWKYEENQEQWNCVGGNRLSKLDKYGLICLIASYTGTGNRQEITVCVKVSRKRNIWRNRIWKVARYSSLFL